MNYRKITNLFARYSCNAKYLESNHYDWTIFQNEDLEELFEQNDVILPNYAAEVQDPLDDNALQNLFAEANIDHSEQLPDLEITENVQFN